MDSHRAYHLFRQNFLYISPPRNAVSLKKLSAIVEALVARHGNADGSCGASGVSLDVVRRLIADAGEFAKADSGLLHAWTHIRVVADNESRHAREVARSMTVGSSRKSSPKRIGTQASPSSASEQPSDLIPSTHALFAAFLSLCRSSEQFPVPQMTLMELAQAFQCHMRFHQNAAVQGGRVVDNGVSGGVSAGGGGVTGDYVLKAISRFFCCDKNEAMYRYAFPLLDVGCIELSSRQVFSLTASTEGNASVTLGRFEKCIFHVMPVRAIQLRRFPLREVLSRFVCIFCHRSCVEGGNELIYLSHSRWAFSPKPRVNESGLSLNSPFSQFPEHLRRGFLGPVMQFVTAFCMTDCTLQESQNTQCAIMRMDGVKLAVAQLSPVNVALLAINPDKGAVDRCDCPVSVLFGFPEHVPDHTIHLTVRRMLHTVELLEGPREQLSFGKTGDTFREDCRRIGRRLYAMCSEILYHPEIPEHSFSRIALDTELLPFFDRGIRERKQLEVTRRSFVLNGFPGNAVYALNRRPGVCALSRKTARCATEVLLRFKNACCAFGGTLCSAIFFHGGLVLSDGHPYLVSLLHLMCVASDDDRHWVRQIDDSLAVDARSPTAAKVAVREPTQSWTNGRSTREATRMMVGETLQGHWTGIVPGFQLPRGSFADETFSVVYSAQRAKAQNGKKKENVSNSRKGSGSSTRTLSSVDSSIEASVSVSNCFISHHLWSKAIDGAIKPAVSSAHPEERSVRDAAEGGQRYLTARITLFGLDVVLLTAFKVPSTDCDQRTSTLPPYRTAVEVAAEQYFMDEVKKTTQVLLALATSVAAHDRPKRPAPAYANGDATSAAVGSASSGSVASKRASSGAGSSAASSGAAGAKGIPDSGIDTSIAGHNSKRNQAARRNAMLAHAASSTSSMPAAIVGDLGATVPTPATLKNQGTGMRGVRSATSGSALCVVHDLTQGTTEFLGASEILPDGSVQPETSNYASAFAKECSLLQSLLGAPLGCTPRANDDINSSVFPFNALPVTRVAFGRSAFSPKDRTGTLASLYGRQTAGQQCVYGSTEVSLRNAERAYNAFITSETADNQTVV